MKYLIFFVLAFMSLSCGGNSEQRASEADITASKNTARTEAEAVLILPEGSMEQENAILAIRAHESEIRKAGFEECADSFEAEALRVLMPVLKSDKVILE